MNTLFPIFVKPDQLEWLLVGGGNVGLEKLEALLRNCQDAKVTVVADRFHPDLIKLASSHPSVKLVERKVEISDLEGKDLVIMATDQPELHKALREETRKRNILINVADTPHLCDFYLGSIVQKGDLKIAISTNGKSPTLAKRLRETLEQYLPDELQAVMDNLQAFRDRLKGDFQYKVKTLNELTQKALKDD